MSLFPGVYENGRPDGPVVVLLHSSLSSARQWQALISELQGHWRILNLDLLGYGQAPAPHDKERPFSLAQEVQRIEGILADYEVESFTLVGHSFGGAVALKLAYELGDRVESMALFEPVAFHLLNPDSEGLTEVLSISGQMTQADNFQAAQQFVDYWNGKGYFAALPERLQAGMAAQVPKVRQDFEGLIGEGYTLTDYRALTLPCLLMAGEQSRRSSRAVAKALSHTLPDCRFTFTPGGHMAPISHSEAVNKHILCFLDSISSHPARY
ncbi:2-succinyl-6-hydroxy-2,4-cyclohexadiene-1-carboxylate synthase [Saliniradius amylolyticus]|uniref:2-succinyl-6-hydroxy-2, 4-cyclohexadiene-1-carboxylate synthase n=1 Tax=Saliniradius amylolyticus TaxID=2183582 RepID=A0A2S2E287_9ALTE|nr:alpha/beta hydrolase [Saliniradius amylolyticus]AWL11370.1 2-succinyl-6-hydroxy-2,4-cyclohexadiene-1-carboxylate synthase [Saliniradius amylolyticus]